MPSPEELARQEIDELLKNCGWQVQNRSTINVLCYQICYRFWRRECTRSDSIRLGKMHLHR
jgi:hypothetical protein